MIDYTRKGDKVYIRLIDTPPSPSFLFFDRYGGLHTPENIAHIGENRWVMDYDEDVHFEDYFIVNSEGKEYIAHKPPKFDKKPDVDNVDSGDTKETTYDIERINKKYEEVLIYRPEKNDSSRYGLNFVGFNSDSYGVEADSNFTGYFKASISAKEDIDEILSSPDKAYDVSGQTFIVGNDKNKMSYLISSDKNRVNYISSSLFDEATFDYLNLSTTNDIVKETTKQYWAVVAGPLHEGDSSRVTEERFVDRYKGQGHIEGLEIDGSRFDADNDDTSTLEEKIGEDVLAEIGMNYESDYNTTYDTFQEVEKDVEGTVILNEGEYISRFDGTYL